MAKSFAKQIDAIKNERCLIRKGVMMEALLNEVLAIGESNIAFIDGHFRDQCDSELVHLRLLVDKCVQGNCPNSDCDVKNLGKISNLQSVANAILTGPCSCKENEKFQQTINEIWELADPNSIEYDEANRLYNIQNQRRGVCSETGTCECTRNVRHRV